MEVKIVAKHANLTFPTGIPGCVLAACTSQDDTMPSGNGHVFLDYTAAGPSTKLKLLAPGDVYGSLSADLDTGNPTNVTLTSGNGKNFILISAVTSATIGAVTTDTAYPFTCRAVGDVCFYGGGYESVAAAVQAAVRARIDFTGANFDGLDLSGADLSAGKFTHASFVGCKMVGCNLTSATCSYADFTGADLSGATLTSIVLTGATLSGSDELSEKVGAMTFGGTAVSADASVGATDFYIAFTTGSGGARTVTLPAASANAGRMLFIFKADSGTTAGVIAAAAGGDTVNGAASVSLPTQNHGYLLCCSGSAWIGEYISTLIPAAASGLATLSAGSLVVQNPANATATPTASKIPIANASGQLALGWTQVPPTTPGAYPYTVLATDHTLLVVEGGAGVTNVVELPAATGSGRILNIVLTAVDAGALEVGPAAGEQINALGPNTHLATLDTAYDCIQLMDTAAGWWRQISASIAP